MNLISKKMKPGSWIVALLLFSFVLFSCRKDCIEGSGQIITDYIDVEGFTGIITEGDFDVIIDTSSTFEVTLEADRTFVPYIKFEKSGPDLIISTSSDRCFDGKRPYIHIYAPNIEYINLSGLGTIQCYDLYNEEITIENEGSGRIELYNLDTYNVFADLIGSGKIYLEGEGKFADYKHSGSGEIDGFDFLVDRGNVLLSGSGDVYIDAYPDLDIVISGSGTVYYKSYPGLKLFYDIPGSGEVIGVN